MTAGDTIFALSSGSGRSAISVIRLSGPATGALLSGIAGALPSPRKLALRNIRVPATEELLDRAMIAWLPGPRSFTGEDCAELHLHGSPAILAAVMTCLSSWPGVRPAEQGEFTRRAFASGKLDLVEVEGLADLLEARTAFQRRQAVRQMSGQSSLVFETWRERLLLIRANIEAAVDFADEAGVAEAATPGIDRSIQELLADIEREVARSASSEIVRAGARIVLAGRPNTGKSSLLNAMARREAAIVSEVPGTTRDAIEVAMDIEGLPVVLTDTAGLRPQTEDLVEAEGIRRSHRHILEADMVLWVWSPDIEGSEVPDPGIRPDIVIRNKSDLVVHASKASGNDAEILVSCRTGEGLSLLAASIRHRIRDRFVDMDSAVLVTARQKTVTERSIRFLNDALAVGAESLELKAESIRRATEEVARLTGRVDVEEWLGAIFSRFCIGK